MAVEVSVPQLGVTMESGVLVEWLVADGAQVSEGEVIYLLGTDKTETEIESPAGGTITLKGAEGETYPVGTVVAEIA
ncbi:biotin/lipoyl-containing protein [Streptomyces sp. NPDC048106]|uniref:biotin/lipoyl-containing protein n=1 Tax=Streptomyces sp. NPDC048106 TaxID=3155750 RepID=UPI0034520826